MHQPTLRVIKILEATAGGGELKLSELSSKLNIPKSTLSPILNTLAECGYLSGEGGEYTPGVALYSFGNAFSGSFPVIEYVKERLKRLVFEFGETCYFGVLDGGYVLYVDKVDSTNPLRVLVTTGRRLPAYSTGIGKALLTDKTEEELLELYPDGFERITDKTVTDVKRLLEELKAARESGYTEEIEESTEHIRCFGAPIRKGGKVAAAISIAIPVFRFDGNRGKAMADALKKTAEEISEVLDKTGANIDNIFGRAFIL